MVVFGAELPKDAECHKLIMTWELIAMNMVGFESPWVSFPNKWMKNNDVSRFYGFGIHSIGDE